MIDDIAKGVVEGIISAFFSEVLSGKSAKPERRSEEPDIHAKVRLLLCGAWRIKGGVLALRADGRYLFIRDLSQKSWLGRFMSRNRRESKSEGTWLLGGCEWRQVQLLGSPRRRIFGFASFEDMNEEDMNESVLDTYHIDSDRNGRENWPGCTVALDAISGTLDFVVLKPDCDLCHGISKVDLSLYDIYQDGDMVIAHWKARPRSDGLGTLLGSDEHTLHQVFRYPMAEPGAAADAGAR